MGKKSTRLKVASVLILIGAVCALLLGLGFLGALGAALLDSYVASWYRWIIAVLVIILAIVDLMAGIAGLQASAGKKDVAVCVKYGYAVVAIAIVSLVLDAYQYRQAVTLIGALLSLLFPILYLTGAKRSVKESGV